jgi:hypothetical protein
MTAKTQKLICTTLVFLATAFSFWGLLQIVNADQIAIYLRTAFYFWLFIWVFITFLFDLHFKDPLDRFRHFLTWKSYSRAAHYLLIPSFIFWSSAVIFYLELAHYRTQDVVAIISLLALTVDFYYIKEVFSRKKELVDADIFAAASVIKIYSMALAFAAAMGLMRSYCLPASWFFAAILALSFLHIYLALYQHRLVEFKHVMAALLISALLGLAGYFIYVLWNYNYFTASIFFAAIYNLFWGTYHYHLDRSLTKKAFFEILIVCLLIAYMVLSVTNFRGQILGACQGF